MDRLETPDWFLLTQQPETKGRDERDRDHDGEWLSSNSKLTYSEVDNLENRTSLFHAGSGCVFVV